MATVPTNWFDNDSTGTALQWDVGTPPHVQSVFNIKDPFYVLAILFANDERVKANPDNRDGTSVRTVRIGAHSLTFVPAVFSQKSAMRFPFIQPGGAANNSQEIRRTRVISQLNTPPVSPGVGDEYLVGPSPTGEFVGHANELAFRLYRPITTIWTFLPLKHGQVVIDDAGDTIFTGFTEQRSGGRTARFADQFTTLSRYVLIDPRTSIRVKPVPGILETQFDNEYNIYGLFCIGAPSTGGESPPVGPPLTIGNSVDFPTYFLKDLSLLGTNPGGDAFATIGGAGTLSLDTTPAAFPYFTYKTLVQESGFTLATFQNSDGLQALLHDHEPAYFTMLNKLKFTMFGIWTDIRDENPTGGPPIIHVHRRWADDHLELIADGGNPGFSFYKLRNRVDYPHTVEVDFYFGGTLQETNIASAADTEGIFPGETTRSWTTAGSFVDVTLTPPSVGTTHSAVFVIRHNVAGGFKFTA